MIDRTPICRLSCIVATMMSALCIAAIAATQAINGNTTIRGKAGDSEIVVTTTSRVAGAIDSLTWGGMEFIDSHDHGRQLQTAWNADAGKQPIASETYNPTEAGSRDDGRGNTSTSKLLEFKAHANTVDLLSQPAFWLKPGERSGENLARNKTLISDHLLRKHVVIGYKGLPNVIDETMTITIPYAEHNTSCTFEVLTGYMPAKFSRFLTFDTKTGRLAALSDGPGEQAAPIIFSTIDGSHAMGVFLPSPPGAMLHRPTAVAPSYGRWKFVPEHVVKWNCVYRIRDPKGLGGDYAYRVFVAVGSLVDVATSMRSLGKEWNTDVLKGASN